MSVQEERRRVLGSIEAVNVLLDVAECPGLNITRYLSVKPKTRRETIRQLVGIGMLTLTRYPKYAMTVVNVTDYGKMAAENIGRILNYDL